MKNVPKEVSGTMTGCLTFCGSIGQIIFSLIGGSLYGYAGAVAPFYGMFISDASYAIFVILIFFTFKK